MVTIWQLSSYKLTLVTFHMIHMIPVWPAHTHPILNYFAQLFINSSTAVPLRNIWTMERILTTFVFHSRYVCLGLQTCVPDCFRVPLWMFTLQIEEHIWRWRGTCLDANTFHGWNVYKRYCTCPTTHLAFNRWPYLLHWKCLHQNVTCIIPLLLVSSSLSPPDQPAISEMRTNYPVNTFHSPRAINFKFPLQPHQKCNTHTVWRTNGFS